MVKDKRQLFELLLKRVDDVAQKSKLDEPQAFGKWFAELYFANIQGLEIPDGAGDGKVDVFFHTTDGKTVTHYVVNSKFTREYDKPAPPSFYNEVARFTRAFEKIDERERWLRSVVRDELRSKYKKLFEAYDDGRCALWFVTNHRRNERQEETLKRHDLSMFHLEDIISFIADDLEAAMPRTPDLVLTSIRANDILRPDPKDTTVPTALVFAKAFDFINYMAKKDPLDMLFARNIRRDFGVRERIKEGRPKSVNEEILETFRDHPEEFVYSNNGVTLLCEQIQTQLNSNEVTIVNPRVVNGSQTLHSVRRATDPSKTARVLVKIIQVPQPTEDSVRQVPQPTGDDVQEALVRRREIIRKISTRTNRQTPIKKWNLVSNDDYQNELARTFKKWDLFYERRVGDWHAERVRMKSIGISQGPGVTLMAQLVASYHWNNRELGPIKAKVSADTLFDERPYRVISGTSAEACYQMYELSTELDSVLASQKTPKWVSAERRHARLLTFSLAARALESAGGKLGTLRMARIMDSSDVDWKPLALACATEVHRVFEHARKQSRARDDGELSINNFVKSRDAAKPLLAARSAAGIGSAARAVVRAVR